MVLAGCCHCLTGQSEGKEASALAEREVERVLKVPAGTSGRAGLGTRRERGSAGEVVTMEQVHRPGPRELAR